MTVDIGSIARWEIPGFSFHLPEGFFHRQVPLHGDGTSTLAGSLEYELDLMTESRVLDKEKVNELRMRICSDLLPK